MLSESSSCSRFHSVLPYVVQGHVHRQLQWLRPASRLGQQQPSLQCRHDSSRERLGVSVRSQFAVVLHRRETFAQVAFPLGEAARQYLSSGF